MTQFVKITLLNYLGNDQEIDFQAIEIGLFHEIESFYKILQIRS